MFGWWFVNTGGILGEDAIEKKAPDYGTNVDPLERT